MDRFDDLSPLDFRYRDEALAAHLSENAFTRYKCRVELALVTVLHRRGLCDEGIVREVAEACDQVTTAEVYEEEGRIHHDIRALVNCIQRRVSLRARPLVHMTATSYDIVDTANALRFRAAMLEVFLPALRRLESVLIDLALREAETLQVGRTHGQHAPPVTFGFAIAGTVERLGSSILALEARTGDLRGKFSGAVGACNASSLFFTDPEAFEAEVLAELGLAPARHSTQIVPPEGMTRLLLEVAAACGIMADLADDMRHLQRTEISEVGEAFEAGQVGSSTMPHKANPINLENAKSMWKIVVGRMVTILMDQLSEHQRDLTNSASGRTAVEVIGYALAIARRLARTMGKLSVHSPSLERNLHLQGDLIIAEPLYIILAGLGHPDAHEKVRLLAREARSGGLTIGAAAMADGELLPYMTRMTPEQLRVITDPSTYTGIAAKRARAVALHWKAALGL